VEKLASKNLKCWKIVTIVAKFISEHAREFIWRWSTIWARAVKNLRQPWPSILSIEEGDSSPGIGQSCLFVFFFFFFFFLAHQPPQWARVSSLSKFLDHTQRRITVGRTPLEEWSARRRDLYLTTHNTHNRQTSMPPGGIRTHDLSRRAAADPRLRPCGHWNWLGQSWINLFLEISPLKFTVVNCINLLDKQISLLTLRRLMSYIYGAPILDVSRSHTTTQHSR